MASPASIHTVSAMPSGTNTSPLTPLTTAQVIVILLGVAHELKFNAELTILMLRTLATTYGSLNAAFSAHAE